MTTIFRPRGGLALSSRGCCDGGNAPDICCDGATVGWPQALSPIRSTVHARALGHTAYHHVGALGDNQPPPANPYYSFIGQRRAPYDWAGGAGGVPRSRVAAESRGLSNADLLESGLEAGQYLHSPAFQYTHLHDPRYIPSGDWPLLRPAGIEPPDPRGDGALGLSDNEKRLGFALAAVGLGWLLWKHMGKAGRPGSRKIARKTRRLYARANPANPSSHRYKVVASTKRRGRRRQYGAIGFTTKAAAQAYAEDLRKGGHKARVRKA